MKRLIIFLSGFTGLIFLLTSPSYSNTIDELNAAIQAKGARWVAKETPFSHIPKEEWGKLTDAVDALEFFGKPTDDSFYAPLSVPSSFDWAQNGGNYVTSVKFQHPECQSCVTHTFVGAMESKFLIIHDMPGFDLNLSEQIVLSCCSATNGCKGYGSNKDILGFLESTGTYLESCYPYTATDGDCSKACANWQTNAYKIDGWATVVAYNVDQSADLSTLKNALYTNGPLAVQMKEYEDFLNYGGSIYSHTSGEYINTKFVLLVGWDDSKGAFRCKNSYGTNWGEEGFFWISYNELYGIGPVEFGRWVTAIGNVISPIIINISVTPAALDFGNINVGQSANQTITITNQTNSTVALTGNVGSPSAPFSVVSGGGAFNLYPGQSSSVTVQFTPPSADTAFGNLSITDNATNQTSQTNNIMLSGTGVTVPAPNVVISSISGPSQGKPGGRISIQNTVTNQGTLTSSKAMANFYLSSDTQINAEDSLIGKRSIPSLSPGASSGPVSTMVTIPRNTAQGSYFIGGIVGNNTNSDSKGITICLSLSKLKLLAPKNRGTNVSTTPALSWSNVSGVSSYEVQVATDSGFTNIVASMTGLTGIQWTVTPALSSGTTYFWRARAVNACGPGPWSMSWSFKTM